MNVFLVQAAAYSPTTERSMPLGIMYLASFLRERSACRVGLFDMQLGARTTAPAVAAARAFGPDLIGIGGMTPDARVMDSLARDFKAAFPTVPIVAGGVHATNASAEVMKNDSIDFLIAGEGEIGCAALVEHLEGKRREEQVPGLFYRRDGNLISNEPAPFVDDLDSLPRPAYDLIDLDAYFRIPRCGVIYSNYRYAAVVSSRGCPYRCAYCHKILGSKWRPRSAESAVDEMEWLARDYWIGDFVIMDDLFNLDPDRINRMARLILDRRLKVKLSFPIWLRGDIMTEESVRLLARAGMFRCMYAVETASDRLQKMIHKNNDLEKIKRIIEYTRAQGVMVHGSFMLGFPTETEAEARATVEWALRSRLHTAAFYRVIPFQGTDLCRMANEYGVKIPENPEGFEFHRANVVNVSAMPDLTINRLKREAYRRFYFSFARLWCIFQVLPNKWRTIPALFAIWIRKAFLW